MTTPDQTQKFSEAYQQLAKAAETIQRLPEDDLDGLLAAVKQAKAAQAVCEARHNAARAELEQLLAADAPPSDGDQEEVF